MMGVIRTSNGNVTVVDGDVGSVTAPSEYEAWREIDRRKDTRPDHRKRLPAELVPA